MERSVVLAHYAVAGSETRELTLSQLVALIGVVGALLGVVKWVVPFVVKVVHFIDDAMGEKARPGVAARPGMLSRMASLEERVSKLDDILHELKPNGGASLADAIRRIEAQLDQLNRKDDAA